MNPNILQSLKLQARIARRPSIHGRIQKAVRLGLLALVSLLTFSVANAAPPATHDQPIKKKCYCARSSDNADRAYLNSGTLHFNPIDGQPIR